MTGNPEIEDVTRGSVEILELNLLHVAWSCRFEPLRLNKNGSPNRRSLMRPARGIVMPGMRREIGEAVDLTDAEQIDYVAFLLAMSIELGTLVVSDRHDELGASHEAMDKFFGQHESVRTRRLYDALSRLRLWNELSSHAFLEPQDLDDEHLSLLAPTGERLIGARGAVFSVLKRLDAEDGWMAIEDLAHACRDRADDYLNRALDDDVAVLGFAHAIVRRALSWTGFVDVGRHADGRSMFRIESRGRQAFGLEEPSAPGEAGSGKCLIVQPNLEITVMLDGAELRVLHELYRVSERRALADRVATFAISARTVQRGYANGATAVGMTKLLSEKGMTPLPESIRFQLEDWERVHRRVSVYADGILFRHPDPDQLDLVVGQLEHENPDVEFVRLGPSTTFAASSELDGLRRFLQRDHAIDVDYLGFLPPALRFVGPLEVAFDPMRVDVITAWELERISRETESTRTEKRHRLDPDLIRRRWPGRPFHNVVEFLEGRVSGGLPPVQFLKLRSLLDAPPRASLLHDVTVLTIDSPEDADRLADAPEIAQFVLHRLGQRAFAVDAEREKELLDVLHEIGIRGGSFDE